MKKLIDFILKYRWFIIAIILIITFIFGYIASTANIASSIGGLLFGKENEDYVYYLDRIREFANDEIFIIAWETSDPFSAQTIDLLTKLELEIKKIPIVRRVDSIIDAQHIHSTEDTLYIDNYTDLIKKNPNRSDELKNELISDPLYGSLVISHDGNHIAMIVELTPDEDRPIEEGPKVVEKVYDILEDNGLKRDQVHVGGIIATLSEVIHQSQLNLRRLFPIVCVVLLLMVYILFNRLWPVFVTLLVSLIAVIWAMGFAVLLDRDINILVSFTPAVILIIATSDVVHLCSAYMLELNANKDKYRAIMKSVSEVGKACLMTSATTFVGFVSLSLIPVPVFRQLGLVFGFGVATALLLAITILPILFSIMKRPKTWHRAESPVIRMMDAVLDSIRRISTRNPIKILIVFSIVLILSIYGITMLYIECDFNKRFSENNEIRIDEKYFQRHFAGFSVLDIFIDATEQDGLIIPENYRSISKFQKSVNELLETDKVISFVTLIEEMDRVFNNGNATALSDMTKPMLAQYLLLFEMSGGRDLDRFLGFERKTMRIAVRLTETGSRAVYDIAQKVNRIADKQLNENLRIENTGMMYITGVFLDDILLGQKAGLITAFITIMLLMMIWTRSVKIGLWSMIPNVLPILILGGYIGLFWDFADSDTIAIGIIAIGIAVDDTIHFLIRYKIESEKGLGRADAIKQTFHYSGRAIVITSLILVVGFAPFAISPYYTVHIMGTLLPLTLIVALVADLFLATVFTKLGIIKFRKRK